MTVLRIAGIAACAMALAATNVAAQDSGIAGTWRGTSTCVDQQHFPACHDEVVIYEAGTPRNRGDSVSIAADKIVNGAREPMGELQYARQSDGSWLADFQNSRTHIQIVLRVTGDHVAGTMTDVPSGRRVREIVLDRSR